MIIVKIFDIETHRVVWATIDSGGSSLYWMEGNGSCDCNRKLYFNREIGKVNNTDEECISERFLILDKIEYEYDNDININIDKNELPYDYTFDYTVFYDYNQSYYVNFSEVFGLLRKLHNRATKIDTLLNLL